MPSVLPGDLLDQFLFWNPPDAAFQRPDLLDRNKQRVLIRQLVVQPDDRVDVVVDDFLCQLIRIETLVVPAVLVPKLLRLDLVAERLDPLFWRTVLLQPLNHPLCAHSPHHLVACNRLLEFLRSLLKHPHRLMVIVPVGFVNPVLYPVHLRGQCLLPLHLPFQLLLKRPGLFLELLQLFLASLLLLLQRREVRAYRRLVRPLPNLRLHLLLFVVQLPNLVLHILRRLVVHHTMFLKHLLKFRALLRPDLRLVLIDNSLQVLPLLNQSVQFPRLLLVQIPERLNNLVDLFFHRAPRLREHPALSLVVRHHGVVVGVLQLPLKDLDVLLNLRLDIRRQPRLLQRLPGLFQLLRQPILFRVVHIDLLDRIFDRLQLRFLPRPIERQQINLFLCRLNLCVQLFLRGVLAVDNHLLRVRKQTLFQHRPVPNNDISIKRTVHVGDALVNIERGQLRGEPANVLRHLQQRIGNILAPTLCRGSHMRVRMLVVKPGRHVNCPIELLWCQRTARFLVLQVLFLVVLEPAAIGGIINPLHVRLDRATGTRRNPLLVHSSPKVGRCKLLRHLPNSLDRVLRKPKYRNEPCAGEPALLKLRCVVSPSNT